MKDSSSISLLEKNICMSFQLLYLAMPYIWFYWKSLVKNIVVVLLNFCYLFLVPFLCFIIANWHVMFFFAVLASLFTSAINCSVIFASAVVTWILLVENNSSLNHIFDLLTFSCFMCDISTVNTCVCYTCMSLFLECLEHPVFLEVFFVSIGSQSNRVSLHPFFQFFQLSSIRTKFALIPPSLSKVILT